MTVLRFSSSPAIERLLASLQELTGQSKSAVLAMAVLIGLRIMKQLITKGLIFPDTLDNMDSFVGNDNFPE